MKPVSITCTVLLFLTCTCFLQNAALPFTEKEVGPRAQSEAPQESEQEPAASAADMNPEVLFRTKRQSHLSLCRYCCNCCSNKGCGFCCKF